MNPPGRRLSFPCRMDQAMLGILNTLQFCYDQLYQIHLPIAHDLHIQGSISLLSVKVIVSPFHRHSNMRTNANRAPGNGISVVLHHMKTWLFCGGIVITSFVRRNSSSTTLYAIASNVDRLMPRMVAFSLRLP